MKRVNRKNNLFNMLRNKFRKHYILHNLFRQILRWYKEKLNMYRADKLNSITMLQYIFRLSFLYMKSMVKKNKSFNILRNQLQNGLHKLLILFLRDKNTSNVRYPLTNHAIPYRFCDTLLKTVLEEIMDIALYLYVFNYFDCCNYCQPAPHLFRTLYLSQSVFENCILIDMRHNLWEFFD